MGGGGERSGRRCGKMKGGRWMEAESKKCSVPSLLETETEEGQRLNGGGREAGGRRNDMKEGG